METSNTYATITAMFAARNAKLKLTSYDAAGNIPGIKPIYCGDGVLNMSVQASRKHFCFPKNNEGPYTRVEVGFPSVVPPQTWKEYCVGNNYDKKPCDSVFANVPLELVASFIDLHGGIKAEAGPQTIVPEQQTPVHRTALDQRRYNLTIEDLGYKV